MFVVCMSSVVSSSGASGGVGGISLEDRLFEEMQHPVTGVATSSRKVLRPLAMGYKRQHGVFTGTDAVSWLVAHLRQGTRGEAASLLGSWVGGGRVGRVAGPEGRLDDRNALFCFAAAAARRAAEPRLPRARLPPGTDGLHTLRSSLFPALLLLLAAPAPADPAAPDALPLINPAAPAPTPSSSSGPQLLAAACVSAARGRKKARQGHFLALTGGSTAPPSLQLGRAEGEVLRVVSAWPLRAIVNIEADRSDPCGFIIGLRREGTAPLEYRFRAENRPMRDRLLATVLRTGAEQLRYEPRTNVDWRSAILEAGQLVDDGGEKAGGGSGANGATGAGGAGGGGSGANIGSQDKRVETLEGQSEDDVRAQQRLWEEMRVLGMGAAAAGDALEARLGKLRLEQATALCSLEGRLSAAHEAISELSASAGRAHEAMKSKVNVVAEGESHIRAIRGHEAQRERAARHAQELGEVLQRLMSALSVPPRYLALLRDPDWNRDDPGDQLAALRALDKVVTLKDLDPRLLQMRAVSDRSQEYRALQASFADTLAQRAADLLQQRAAADRQTSGSAAASPPLPFHTHLQPLMALYAALPPTQLSRLLDIYMDAVRPVYASELQNYFAGLLATVRRRAELSILEAFHLALQAVWGLIQAELEFWTVLQDTAVLVARLGDVFVAPGEELGQFVDYADRHMPLDVIGMLVEATSWQTAGEPMQSVPAVVAISGRLSGLAQRHVQKMADTALQHLCESHMARGRSGPLSSLERLPAFLDNIHSYGPCSRTVTASITDKVLPALLEYLESPEAVKELIKFDSSKMTILAGRLENYHYLWQVLEPRAAQVAALAPFAEQCRERWERNLQAFISYLFEREFHSLHEYFAAVVRMKRTVPAQEIPFQPSLSRAAFAALNRKYNVSAWEKKSSKVRKVVTKNIGPSLCPLVLKAFREALEARFVVFRELLLECYGPQTTFAVDDIARFFPEQE